MGRICAAAGLRAIPPRAVTNIKELERRFIGPTNLFISNDNPRIQTILTWLARQLPAAATTQSLRICAAA
jgi:hypothetical protein